MYIYEYVCACLIGKIILIGMIIIIFLGIRVKNLRKEFKKFRDESVVAVDQVDLSDNYHTKLI